MLVVEESSGTDQRFIFQYNKNVIYAKCEGCLTIKELTVDCVCKKVKYCNEDCRFKDESYHLKNCDALYEIDFASIKYKPLEGARNGITGLTNLGNTCYMNSALQCLSNTYALTKYFLNGHFVNEINQTNALGTQGKLAFQYSSLLNELWYKTKDCYTPYALKRQIGKTNPMVLSPILLNVTI